MKLCVNSSSLIAWYCYHHLGRITSGKEALSARGRCESCDLATPPYEEEPSFMKNNEE